MVCKSQAFDGAYDLGSFGGVWQLSWSMRPFCCFEGFLVIFINL